MVSTKHNLTEPSDSIYRSKWMSTIRFGDNANNLAKLILFLFSGLGKVYNEWKLLIHTFMFGTFVSV